MQNEILLALSLVFIFGGVLVMYRIFGITGLYCATVIATITANIEVLLMVDAYGMEQTLGNILFAATFLITDILSENHGKAAAQSGREHRNRNVSELHTDITVMATLYACRK